MISTPKRCAAVAALLFISTAIFAAPPADDEKPPSEPAPTTTKKASTAPSDAAKLPDDAILVIVEKAADALRRVPAGALVLTPEKYRELVERARARDQRPTVPSACELKGKVEGNLFSLQAQFDFRTDSPQVAVRLACREARAVDASLDGDRKPLLRYDPADGFTVTVDKPGEHHLKLDLAVAFSQREAGRGLELELPRAAITKLELELPAGSRELRLDGKPFADRLLEFKGNVLKGPLPGSAERLDLAWSGAAVGQGALTVRGRIQVRFEDKQTVGEAELLLKREGGEADVWKVLVPPGSDVKLLPGEEDKLAGIDVDDKAFGPFASLRSVRLKSPAQFIRLAVATRGPQLQPGSTTPVGPYYAPGAVRQEGTILVSNQSAGQRLDFQRRGEVSRRAATPEESQKESGLVAVFHYWGIPLSERPVAATGPGSMSLLDIRAETVRGLVEARINHALQLMRDAGGARHWRLKTRVEATPVRSGVEQMRVQLPPGFRYAAESGATDPAVQSVDPVDGANVLTFHLSGAEAKTFTFNIEGDYSADAAETGKAVLALPRPLEARDLGGQVAVTMPEDYELVPLDGANSALETTARDSTSQTWRSAGFPERVEVAWRPSRPEPQVSAEADVTLTSGEVQVRHALRFHFPRTPPDQVTLRVPTAVGARLRVVRGGTLSSREFLGPTVRAIDWRAAREPSPGRDVTLVVEYSSMRVDRASADAPLSVPLVHPEMAATGEIKVRVWSEPGLSPLPPGGAWSELNVEEVPGHDRLPSLVLRAQRLDAQLAMPLARPEAPTASVLTDRVLVRAEVTESGSQIYRAGFRLDRLEARNLDVELPAAVASLGIHVSLDGKQVAWEAVDDNGQRAAGGRVARLRLGPQLVKHGSILEVAYEMPAGRAPSGLLQTTLTPPVLRGDQGRVPTRWMIVLPPNRLAIAPEANAGQEREWVRQGWLFVPRPAVTVSDLERWLVGSAGASRMRGDESAVPSQSCWRDRPEPLVVTHAPQQGWLLACSLATLGVGFSLLVVANARRGDQIRGWFLPLLAVSGTALAVAALLWPSVVAAIAYGCEPGAAVLAVVVPTLWLQHERERRRRAYPASFSRGRPASSSSLHRAEAIREFGEPSTMDVSRANGSAPRAVPEVPRPEGSNSGRGLQPQGSAGPGS